MQQNWPEGNGRVINADPGIVLRPYLPDEESASSPIWFQLRLADGSIHTARIRGIVRYGTTPQLAVDYYDGTNWETEVFIISLGSGAIESKNTIYGYRFSSSGSGSASSPAIMCGNDPDTGLFFDGQDGVMVSSGGEQVAAFTPSGFHIGSSDTLTECTNTETVSGDTWTELAETIPMNPGEILDCELDVVGVSEDGYASGDYGRWKKKLTVIRDTGASPVGEAHLVDTQSLSTYTKTGSVLDIRLIVGSFPASASDSQPIKIEVKGVSGKSVQWSVRIKTLSSPIPS